MGRIQIALRVLRFTKDMFLSYITLNKAKYANFNLIIYKYFANMLLVKKSLNSILKTNVLENVTICLDEVNGGTPDYEQLVIGAICRRYKPKKIFEIGTYRGKTSLTMSLNTPPDTLIYTLDLPLNFNVKNLHYDDVDNYDRLIIQNKSGDRDVGVNMRTSLYKNKVIQLWGDSANFDFQPYRASIDLVFIDGAHSKKYVESDTKTSENLLGEKGIILWHDYRDDSYEGLREFLNQQSRIWPIFQIENTMLAAYFKNCEL